jgi:YHS domain-containing protein
MFSRLCAGSLSTALLFGFSFLGTSPSAPAWTTQGAAAHAEQKASGDPYLLDSDPVSGKSLGAVDKQVIVVHEGREFRFASAQNAEAFKLAPGKYIPAVDAKLIGQQTPLYPMDTCVVSGDKLGKQGAAYDFVHWNRLVRLSNKDHLAAFLKDAPKFLAKLDAAVIERQKAGYKLTTCVVSGEKLGGEMGDPIDRVFGNRLVRFCCKSCLKDFGQDPLKYLAMLDGTAKPKDAKAGAEKSASYTCPMHPDVVKDKPGACPKCGMDLVKKK